MAGKTTKKPTESSAGKSSAKAANPKRVVVVLRPGWHCDPYRRAGGLVIPSGTPTEVDAETAEYLLTTFPDGFTVEK